MIGKRSDKQVSEAENKQAQKSSRHCQKKPQAGRISF